MKVFSVLLVLVGLLFGAVSSDAQTMYFGAGGAFGWDNFTEDTTISFPQINTEEVDGSWALHLFFGYNLSANFAVEGSYSYNFGWSPDGSAEDEPKLTRWSVLGSVKVSLATEASFVPYLIIGIGWGGLASDNELLIVNGDGEFDFTQGGFVSRIGSGLEYKVSDSIKAFTDVGYNFAFQELQDWDFTDLRAGLAYSF